MKQAYSKGISGWGQLGILVGMIGAGLVIGSVASLIIWVAMTHTSIMSMPTEMLKPQHYNALIAVQVVTTIIAFFLPAVVYAKLCYQKSWTFLGFTGEIKAQQLAAVCLLAFCTLPLIAGLSELNKAIPLPHNLRLKFDAAEKSYAEQVGQIAQVKTWAQYFLSLLVIAVLPAIVEETLFRGALQNLLTRWTKLPALAIVVTGIVFSAIHLSWYGFLPRMVLGILLGVLFYYGQSIWLNILAHFINNALAITSLFVTYRQHQKVDLNAEEHFPIWATLISLFLIASLVTWFIRISPPPQTSAEDFTFDTRNPFANHVE